MKSEANTKASLDNQRNDGHTNHRASFEQATHAQWTTLAVAGLRSESADNEALQALRHTTLDGIPVEVLYDASHMDFTRPRGSTLESAIDNRVAVQAADSKTANAAILDALAGGAKSIELHIQDENNLSACLNNVQLDIASIALRTGHRFSACAGAFTDYAVSSGVALDSLHCLLASDPIGEMLSGNVCEQTLPSQLTSLAQHAKSIASTLPHSYSVLVDTAVHHNAGASVVEELHAALATALVYLEAMLDNGMPIHEARTQVVFQLALDSDVLLGVAKLRALQYLWQSLLRTIDSSYEQKSAAQVVVETSQRQLSQLQPWNNHLRNLAACTAAMLGSADTLLVHPHDILLANVADADKKLSKRMARNIAIILERECGLGKVHDPMSGSYAMENLTEQLISNTWQSLTQTDTSEGWLNELASGRWQTRVTQTHQQRIKLLQEEKSICVGVNRYVHSDEAAAVSIQQQIASPPALQAVRDSAEFEHSAINKAEKNANTGDKP